MLFEPQERVRAEAILLLDCCLVGYYLQEPVVLIPANTFQHISQPFPSSLSPTAESNSELTAESNNSALPSSQDLQK